MKKLSIKNFSSDYEYQEAKKQVKKGALNARKQRLQSDCIGVELRQHSKGKDVNNEHYVRLNSEYMEYI